MENEVLIYFNEWIDSMKFRMSYNGIKKYYTISNNLVLFMDFLKSDEKLETLQDLNSIRKLRLFNDFLYQKNLGKHHIKRHIDTIKRFVIWCVNDEFLPYSKIRDFEPDLPRYKQKIITLNESELAVISEVKLNDKLNRVRDVFLFQCYTGLSYTDLHHVGPDNILHHGQHSYFCGERKKNENDFCVPLLPEAIDILDKYNFKIPVLSNQKYNAYLKELATACSIDKKLTTHIGRKTCGQYFLNKGFSIEAVSRMLGHSDIKTTQKHYARSSFERIHEENLKMSA